ncbi:hypothetical protein COCON_G00094810 [Conger conger]|uniref:Uncharacterized protein n=1 Tax=Conger conger TaxID=82655 RepID=A0A9Q1DLW3_CONCO|nr:hypothetical protein COCON_G00094810 [Conger conger]
MLRVSRVRMISSVGRSISQKPSDSRASSAWASMTSQQRWVSSGSSNSRLWDSSTQAFFASRLVSRKVTQAFARAGTMYFLAAYKVANTVSASSSISSLYMYLGGEGGMHFNILKQKTRIGDSTHDYSTGFFLAVNNLDY